MNRLTLYDYDDDETLAMQIGNTRPEILATSQAVRLLALGAVAGPVLFTLTWFILGFLSPGFTIFGTVVEPYSPVSHPISGLGLGPYGLLMNATFVVCGLLLMAGAVGIILSIPGIRPGARLSAAVLMAFTGVGMAVDGIFTLEAVLPHTLGFVLGTGAPVLSFLVIGRLFRRIPRWRRLGSLLLVASPVTLVLLVMFFATFDPVASGAGLGIAGLMGRILVVEVHAWFVAMGWLAFRSP